MKWVSRDQRHYMYAVPDGHLDEMLSELAILRETINPENRTFQQIESITNGWIKGVEALATYLEEAELSDIIMVRKAQLIVGKPQGHEEANFTCGCCGNWFKDNVQKQLRYDQDAGYGICSKCQRWH